MSKNFAICVGINNYPGTNNDLGGCINDANDWSGLLRGQGYQVETIFDSSATKQGVLDRLRACVEEARYGDRIVFTYSGHGSWVPDQNGDEIDGRDEVLCTYDFFDGNFIRDDDLADVFGATRRGVGSLILSDSCHSGTISRFASLTGTPRPGTPRFIPPYTFLEGLTQDRAVEIEQAKSAAPRKAASLISGCDDAEYSYDAWFDKANGAFTYYATRAWQPGISLNDWYKAIRASLPDPNYPQTPQLYAASTYRKYSRAI